MELDEVISVIYENVDLSKGYGVSKNWVGYFERNQAFSLSIANKAVSIFLEYFKSELNQIIVVVSYALNKDSTISEEDYLRNFLNPLERELLDLKFIQKEIRNSYFSKDLELNDKQLLELETTFKAYSNVGINILKKISLLAMIDSSLIGHCFFVLKRHNLIIYPHGDDTGYGCIGIDSNINNTAVDFLRHAASQNEFRAYFNPKLSNIKI